MPVTAPAKVRTDVLNLARSQLGVHEIPSNSNRTPYSAWYGIIGPWCAMFVSWCFFHVGFPLKITTDKGFAYCPYGVNWFKAQGKWAPKTTRPQPGWLVFFDFIGRPSHVGIVEGVAADGRIITIEGNTNGAGSRTGGTVMRHYRSVSSGIIGYGILDYIEPATPGSTFIGPPLQGPVKNFDPRVKDLQHKLNLHGAHLIEDGIMGHKTVDAVKFVQALNRMPTTGIVDAKFWALL